MILAKIQNVVLMGLSDKNVELLTSNNPIQVNLSELGFPDIKIFIIHGKTEEEITEDFIKEGLLDPSIVQYKPRKE